MESTKDSSLNDDAYEESFIVCDDDMDLEEEVVSHNGLIYADEILVDDESKYEEVDSTELCMTFDQKVLSPIPSAFSDCGYESHGSPASDMVATITSTEMLNEDDLISELFPSLLTN